MALDQVNKLFIIYLAIAIILRLFLWAEIRYIFGTDTGRFAEIAHIFYLKGKITPDLRPYNMAYGFFYFLLPILMSTVLEYIGIDPITSMTFFVFLFSILSCVIFYFIMKQFFDKKKAAHMFFFYSMVFDITLTFGIAGIYPYALSVLWFFLSIYIINKIFFEKSNSWICLGIVLALFSVTHFFFFFPFLCYLFALVSYEIIEEGNLSKTKYMLRQLLKSSIFPIIINIPIFLVFGRYIGISFNKTNTGLVMAASTHRMVPLGEKIYALLLNNTSLIQSIVFTAGLVFFIITAFKLKKKQKIWIFYTIYLFVHNFIVFNNANYSRIISALWMIFAIGFGNFLTSPPLNVVILPMFYYVPSSSILYYINVLEQKEGIEPKVYPWVLWDDYYKAIDFIKKEVPLNATFLIDSGGAGCFGSSSSYGDRIFSLTSRKPFFFTDYCWAVWDFEDYERRMDIYRWVSINPDNSTIIRMLKEYGVTHVFIGPNDVGLKYELFKNSTHYEEIYNERGFIIFKIK